MTGTMTTLERVARAMAHAWYLNDFEPDEAAALASRDFDDFLEPVRAALEAMREPSEDVKWTAFEDVRRGKDGWEAMIDAILSGDA